MDAAKIAEMASYVAGLKMYPYYDAASYIVMCLMVRDDHDVVHSEDTRSAETSADKKLSRGHPLASWVASMLMCFAGSIFSNALVGEAIIGPFKNHNDVMLATAIWYLVNYSPFDLTYKLAKFLPIRLAIYSMKQIHAVHKIHHGVAYALKNYIGAYVIACLVGVMKGAGYYYMRLISRLICGVWIPSTNEILHPSFASKASLMAAIVFILEHKGYLNAAHVVIYCSIVIFFVYFTISSELLGMHDPFSTFEMIFCFLFFGGLVDAATGAVFGSKKRGSNVQESTSNDRGEPARGKSKGD